MPTPEPEWLTAARERGLVVREGKPSLVPGKAKRRPPELVAPSLVYESFERVVATVPCHVPSLANERAWRTRNRVTQAHRRAVSQLFGRHLRTLAFLAEHYHRGKPLRVTLTRLGGKALDRTANLPASLKYVEDAVALMLGADDGAQNWNCVCEQEPGGAVGVRVTIEAAQSAQVDIG